MDFESRLIGSALVLALVVGCANTHVEANTSARTSTEPTTIAKQLEPEDPQVPVWGYEVVNVYPHDPKGFTQGLVYEDGYFLEGTGLNGESSLRKVEIATGKVLKKVVLDAKYFGEGITLLKGKIYQLTWQTKIGFVYDLKSFEKVGSFKYGSEGWGITHDGEKLIMSDGTATLYFLDPETLKEVGHIEVKDGANPVYYLNELEYVKGEIFANVWQTNTICRIDPKTGKVLGWIDLTGLLKPEHQGSHEVDVLNGIAYDPKGDRLFVTGKLWPKVYEIKLVKK
jgi:glutamine cyclotransferase